jgi:hypothetical protein
MEGKERSVEEEVNVCENQPDSLVGRSDMRVDDEGVYTDTDGRISPATLNGRSPRPHPRPPSPLSTITGISMLSSSLSPATASSCAFRLPGRLLRAPACLGDAADEGGDVCADELELAMLAELSVVAGSVNDLDLCFWRNLGSFEPCCGPWLGDGGGGGVLRDCLDIGDV